MSGRRLYVGWLALHALLVLTVSFQQTFWVLEEGYTSLPGSLEKYWRKAESFMTSVLGETLGLSNPFRQSVNVYINASGIEGGYGFFAPSVPDSYKLVLELHYSDGRVEYELPHVSDTATGVRLATLLDQIGRTGYDPLREIMIKMLAYAAWQDHPDAIVVRAVFGFVALPKMDDVKQGKTESYHFLYAYDFSFRDHPDSAH
ncbi:MAG: hypothetical protein DME28_01715 [Verrucomicrobia bacterium]|nr:MAG: hypothetical protein DME28_01715 [Verrucomicrobiota bacterium]